MRWLAPTTMRCFMVALLSLRFGLPACGAAQGPHRDLTSYRNTSHSLAILVQRPDNVEGEHVWFKHVGVFDGEGLVEEVQRWPKSGQPWWWLVAIKKDTEQDEQPDIASSTWDSLKEKFRQRVSTEDAMKVKDVLSRSERNSDSFGIEDPKVQTVKVSEEVYFRAMPQGRCDNHTKPLQMSFLPQVLEPVPAGECVLELGMLHDSTPYHLVLFNISNGTSLPKAASKVRVGALDVGTLPPPHRVRGAMMWMKVACVLAMVVSVAVSARTECLEWRSHYLELNNNSNGVEEGVGGFNLVKVRNLFWDIIGDVFIMLTMFLPIFGPIGLVLASNVVVGRRIRTVMQSREAYKGIDDHKMERLWQLLKDIMVLVVNVLIIPLNIWMVQMLWATHCSAWYRSFGMDVNGDKSFNELMSYGSQWLYYSGLELGGWVPFTMLSTFILALEMRNDQISEMLQKHRNRAEGYLNSLNKGRELWAKLCKLDGRIFSRTSAVPDPLSRRLIRLSAALVFGLLPHIWMCVRHGVRLWNSWSVVQVTFVYVVNVSGVAARFLALSDRIHQVYKNSCMELATFQALSWQEDRSATIYDPFATRNQDVMEARRRLRDNIPKISCLKLEDPEDSKVWWHLRELVLIQIKDGRIMMEMLVVACIYFSFLVGSSSVIGMAFLQEICTTTVVGAVAMVVLFSVTRRSLRYPRDINLMAAEHTCLLHNVVAEMNMPLGPVRPLDSHLQQERFLLQVATLIEKQPLPETVASFAVTPQFFSLVMLVLGLLTLTSFCNLLYGLYLLMKDH